MGEATLDEKWLAVLGGGKEQEPIYKAATSMGLKTIGFDLNPGAPAANRADVFVPVSSADSLGIIETLETQGIELGGVITLGSDVSVSVAKVQSHFGLPGNAVSVAERFTDKVQMKQALVDRGVPTPRHLVFKSGAEVAVIRETFRGLVIVKPVDGRGARGVQLVDLRKPHELEDAILVSQEASSRGEVIVEEYVPGPQYSTEGIFVGGNYHNAVTSLRNYSRIGEFGLHVIEDGGQIPETDDPVLAAEVMEIVGRASKALGAVTGTVKGDLVRGPDGALQVIELACRLSGGWLASDQIPAARGISFMELAIKSALDFPFAVNEVVPAFSSAVAVRYLFPQSGKIAKISGLNKVQSLAGLVRVGMFRDAGDLQPQVTSHSDRLGFVIFFGDTVEEAVARAESALGLIEVDIV